MRSVVLKTSRRCPRCQLAPRWCICAGHRDIVCPLAIDVLMHHREQFRPSSTGRLINRVIPASRQHVWRRERGLTADEIRLAGRELWIIHPQGADVPPDVAPEGVQLVLLDGSWRETSAMAQEVRGWGRTVRLPMTGRSRYLLRAQSEAGGFSTVEALLYLLQAFGLSEAHAALRKQFELHVYASLRARGHKAVSEELLLDSPILPEFAEVIAQLNVRRPGEDPRGAAGINPGAPQSSGPQT